MKGYKTMAIEIGSKVQSLSMVPNRTLFKDLQSLTQAFADGIESVDADNVKDMQTLLSGVDAVVEMVTKQVVVLRITSGHFADWYTFVSHSTYKRDFVEMTE